MNKNFLIFETYARSFVTAVLFLVSIFFSVNFASANEWTFTDTFESRNLGELNGQGGWAVTNYYGNPHNTVNVSTANSGTGTKFVEITNGDSLIVTRDITPVNAGIFQFRMRHSKSGLFYFYALTSDQGGQLLFSIQFTESKGILLEEADKQITLLPDYNANQWYLFTIDFDNSRGGRGTFKIKIDDGSYSEYKYVHSESAIFDFAQIVFGSDNGVFNSDSNGTAISAFGDIQSMLSSPTVAATTTLATTTAATTTSTKETGIISFIIDGILDFFGIHTATTTATSVEMPPADAPITAAIIATTTPEITVATATPTSESVGVPTASVGTATTSPEEIILPPQDAIISPPEATPAPIIQASSSLAAAVGLLGVKISNGLAAIIIIGILFLAFTLSGQNKKTK